MSTQPNKVLYCPDCGNMIEDTTNLYMTCLSCGYTEAPEG
jgi:hypothetical protein